MRYLYFIFILIAFNSCRFFSKKKTEDIELARVFEYHLYQSDVTGIIPPKSSAKDSIETINSFITNWIKEKIILHKALENLTSDKIDFSKKLEDYKNSLIVYTYETELVKQKLDTTVTEKDIDQYYEKNKNDFELKDNIVKVIYVKLAANAAPRTISLLKQLYKSDTPKMKEDLLSFCQKYAVNYYLDDESWLLFNDLLKEIPIQTYNQENYLQNNRFIEMRDSTYQYFLNIKGFKIKETISPLSFEKDNIRRIIINKRKVKLISDLHDKIYQDALKHNDFEIFKLVK